jgi:hypothetical protein
VWKLIEERKRFPADTTLDNLTFLNDKKINGELYAYLQGLSQYKILDKKNNEYVAFVEKSRLPK